MSDPAKEVAKRLHRDNGEPHDTGLAANTVVYQAACERIAELEALLGVWDQVFEDIYNRVSTPVVREWIEDIVWSDKEEQQ